MTVAIQDKLQTIDRVAMYAGSSSKLDIIASTLCMNIKTLELSLTQIYKKLNITGRLELTHFCISKAIVLNSRNTAGV